MANLFKIPLIWPFKMVPNTATPGIHFDDAWACEQIKSFEKKVYYRQKWVKANTTKLQVTSSIAPETLKVYRTDGSIAKAFTWASVFTATQYSIYETTWDVSDLADGIYIPYQRVTLLSIDWAAIGEPIHIKSSWPNTLLFTYKNSFNKDGMAWTTGIEMKFRCEAGIMDFNPEADISDYINQDADRELIDGIPSRSFKLYIGTAKGVATYIIDVLNRIFSVDYVNIDGLEYCRAGKWEVNRVKGYPLIGGSLEIVPGRNTDSLEFSDTTPLAPGIVTGFDIETAFFGPGATVPITDIEEQS